MTNQIFANLNLQIQSLRVKAISYQHYLIYDAKTQMIKNKLMAFSYQNPTQYFVKSLVCAPLTSCERRS